MSTDNTDILLRVDTVTKYFGGLCALNEVDFSVAGGETLGIIGPNGAGKTTLFNVVSGFEPPSSGTVFFQGGDVTQHPPQERARAGLVRTFQVVRPFPGLTVRENLMVGALSNRVFDTGVEMVHAAERAESVARKLGLTEWLERDAHTLPYGTLKRLEVGRAMILQPRVLLLDEPFAGLAGQEIEDLVRVVNTLSDQGITLVIIEHKLGVLMRIVKRVLVLNFGQLIADGTPREIADNPAVQEAYLGSSERAQLA